MTNCCGHIVLTMWHRAMIRTSVEIIEHDLHVLESLFVILAAVAFACDVLLNFRLNPAPFVLSCSTLQRRRPRMACGPFDTFAQCGRG